jgi:hypothetical protein
MYAPGHMRFNATRPPNLPCYSASRSIGKTWQELSNKVSGRATCETVAVPGIHVATWVLSRPSRDRLQAIRRQGHAHPMTAAYFLKRESDL